MKLGRSTASLMLIVLAVAAFLAFVRDPVRVLLTAGAAGLAAIFASLAWFELLPVDLVNRITRDDRRRLRILKLVAATPCPFGEAGKFTARFCIFERLRASGRLEEAVAAGRALLDSGPKDYNEVAIRHSLADCLDRLGRPEEAAEARQRAESAFDEDFASLPQWLKRGDRFKAQGLQAEAFEAYERALELVPDRADPDPRIRIMLKMAVAAFDAGRPAVSARWSWQAIDLGASGTYLKTAHRMAGLALGTHGRLDEAEAHLRRALELAEEGSADPATVAQCLSQLADNERRRGRLAEAEMFCERVEALGAGGFLNVMVWSDVLRAQGRFEEALGLHERLDTAGPPAVPEHNRRLRGALTLGIAQIEADLLRWDEAEAHCREARTLLESDPKLRLTIEGIETRIAAGLGRRDEVLAGIDLVESRLSEFPEDRSARIGALASIGRAALLLGDFARAESLWSRHLEAGPDPVARPLGLYYRGEALLGLGRHDDARGCFTRAVVEGIDSHHARLARERLDGRA